MDHDLRHDPDAHAIDARNLRTVPFRDPRYAADLRTVAMPELRSPAARTLDAVARELPPRTYDERMNAEFAALRLVVQELRQAVDDLQRTVSGVRG